MVKIKILFCDTLPHVTIAILKKKFILYLYIKLTVTCGNVLLYGRFHCNSVVTCMVTCVVTCPDQRFHRADSRIRLQ